LIAVWLDAMRPRTWPASLVPVAVGLAAAAQVGRLDRTIAALTLLAALALQIATNLANDYFDARSGVDGGARLGPRRATQSGLLSPETVRRATYVALAVAALAGVPLILRGGVAIAAIGILSMLTALAYSAGPRPLASLGLGELLAFGFFGVVAVAGTFYLQSGVLSATVLCAGAAVGCFAAAIMLVNNLRDIPTDAPAGKLTLAVRIGEQASRRLYGLLLVAAVLSSLAVAVAARSLAPLLVAATLPMMRREAALVARRNGAELNTSLAATARLELVYGSLLTLGLVLS
jgi:1,4-dihydroxy-2-naphthoate octaprenyltransferase